MPLYPSTFRVCDLDKPFRTDAVVARLRFHRQLRTDPLISAGHQEASSSSHEVYVAIRLSCRTTVWQRIGPDPMFRRADRSHLLDDTGLDTGSLTFQTTNRSSA